MSETFSGGVLERFMHVLKATDKAWREGMTCEVVLYEWSSSNHVPRHAPSRAIVVGIPLTFLIKPEISPGQVDGLGWTSSLSSHRGF